MSYICECGLEDELKNYFDEISFLPRNILFSKLQECNNRYYISEIDNWIDDYGGNYINNCHKELEAKGNKWLKDHNLGEDFRILDDGYRGVYIKKIKE